MENKNKDILESQLLNSLQKELGKVDEVHDKVVSIFPNQSIIGNGNTQIANHAQVDQSIEGDNNTQIAGNVYITTHLNINEPPPEYISEKQALILSQLVNLIVDTSSTEKTYPSVWYQFKEQFNITEYKRLPVSQFDQAVNYLKQLIGQ